ncbi:cytochrome P450 71B34-like [Malus sylvestris]|uniref:cytochrome P450 71B34-like n=1 Tax=Malus sylvestris TaxID=3752 RepID=UPI0021ABFD9B|nr:cytochrome P450 71B34-like [Malus sylvestris]
MALITSLLICLPFLLLLPLFLLLQKKKNVYKNPQLKKFPPSPPKLLLMGNLHQLGTPPHQSLCQLSKKYGPVMLLHFGHVPALVISSAEAAKDALKTNDLHCCSRPSSAGARRLTYNYLDIAFSPISKELDDFFQQVIDNHLNPGRRVDDEQAHEDIVDVLLKIVKEQSEFGASHLGHNNIKAVLLDLFLAGIDSDAITMVWAMTELSKNPRLMKKAQEEVRKCVGNKGKVTETETDRLQYLKMVIKETLSLHPPAPMILPMETMSHCKIQGYDIDSKALVLVNERAIGTDPEFWKDPEEFIPERFDGSSVDYKGQHFEFLSFGAGRRVCPGIYMGTTTVELGLANLLYWFDWKLPDGMKEEDLDMEETSGTLSLTVSKRTPLNLIPEKISQNLENNLIED